MDATLDPVARNEGLNPGAPPRDRGIAIGLLAASFVLHLAVFVALVLAPDRTAQPVVAAIPVDIVVEASKPSPSPADAARDAPPRSSEPPAAPPRQAPPPPPGPVASETPATASLPPAPTGFDDLPASFRAVALPATSIGGAEAASYKAIVFGLLASAKRYPDAARARGAAGAAVVSFNVDAKGEVLRASLTRSSGDGELDAEALATVRRCNPFPPPPQGAQTSFAAIIEFESEP